MLGEAGADDLHLFTPPSTSGRPWAALEEVGDAGIHGALKRDLGGEAPTTLAALAAGLASDEASVRLATIFAFGPFLAAWTDAESSAAAASKLAEAFVHARNAERQAIVGVFLRLPRKVPNPEVLVDKVKMVLYSNDVLGRCLTLEIVGALGTEDPDVHNRALLALQSPLQAEVEAACGAVAALSRRSGAFAAAALPSLLRAGSDMRRSCSVQCSAVKGLRHMGHTWELATEAQRGGEALLRGMPPSPVAVQILRALTALAERCPATLRRHGELLWEFLPLHEEAALPNIERLLPAILQVCPDIVDPGPLLDLFDIGLGARGRATVASIFLLLLSEGAAGVPAFDAGTAARVQAVGLLLLGDKHDLVQARGAQICLAGPAEQPWVAAQAVSALVDADLAFLPPAPDLAPDLLSDLETKLGLDVRRAQTEGRARSRGRGREGALGSELRRAWALVSKLVPRNPALLPLAVKRLALTLKRLARAWESTAGEAGALGPTRLCGRLNDLAGTQPGKVLRSTFVDLIESIGALAPTLAYHLVPGLLLSFVGTGRSRALSTIHGLMDRLSRRKAFYEMYKVVQMCCVAGLYDVPDKHLPRLLACDVSDRVVFWLQAVQLAASAENGLKEQLSTDALETASEALGRAVACLGSACDPKHHFVFQRKWVSLRAREIDDIKVVLAALDDMTATSVADAVASVGLGAWLTAKSFRMTSQSYESLLLTSYGISRRSSVCLKLAEARCALVSCALTVALDGYGLFLALEGAKDFDSDWGAVASLEHVSDALSLLKAQTGVDSPLAGVLESLEGLLADMATVQRPVFQHLDVSAEPPQAKAKRAQAAQDILRRCLVLFARMGNAAPPFFFCTRPSTHLEIRAPHGKLKYLKRGGMDVIAVPLDGALKYVPGATPSPCAVLLLAELVPARDKLLGRVFNGGRFLPGDQFSAVAADEEQAWSNRTDLQGDRLSGVCQVDVSALPRGAYRAVIIARIKCGDGSTWELPAALHPAVLVLE